MCTVTLMLILTLILALILALTLALILTLTLTLTAALGPQGRRSQEAGVCSTSAIGIRVRWVRVRVTVYGYDYS